MSMNINFIKSHVDQNQTVEPQSVSLHAELREFLMEQCCCKILPDYPHWVRVSEATCNKIVRTFRNSAETARPLTRCSSLPKA